MLISPDVVLVELIEVPKGPHGSEKMLPFDGQLPSITLSAITSLMNPDVI